MRGGEQLGDLQLLRVERENRARRRSTSKERHARQQPKAQQELSRSPVRFLRRLAASPFSGAQLPRDCAERGRRRALQHRFRTSL